MVEVQFVLDTKDGARTVTLSTPFEDRSAAKNKVKSLLSDTANSSSAMMSMKDSSTGDYVFVNTMKISDIVVKKG